MLRTLHIVFATSTGHTEHVVDTLIAHVNEKAKDLRIVKARVERTRPEDFTSGDLLILACGTWNTGNTEGQLNPFMYDLLMNRSKDVDLQKIPGTAIGLGDDRYHFTAKAAEHLSTFIRTHNGTLLLPPLKVINEPYGQEQKVLSWADALLKAINTLPQTS